MIRPFLLYTTSLIFEILFSEMYPISFATWKMISEVLRFTPFLWFRALEMVAGENPVISLICLILAFIFSPPHLQAYYKYFTFHFQLLFYWKPPKKDKYVRFVHFYSCFLYIFTIVIYLFLFFFIFTLNHWCKILYKVFIIVFYKHFMS